MPCAAARHRGRRWGNALLHFAKEISWGDDTRVDDGRKSFIHPRRLNESASVGSAFHHQW